MKIRYLRGCVVHAPSRGSIESFEDAFLSIDAATGRIDVFHPQIQPSDLELVAKCSSSAYLHLALMQWLEKYTFPIEQKFNDPTFAMEWYSKLSDTMLREGITTAQYFPTTHVEATMLLADLVESRGQRGLVGLVSMDRNAPASDVSRNMEKCLEDAEKFITYTMSKGNELVKPVITPRFVPTCSLGLLRGLGALAKKYDIHVQSHIAESKDGCYPETSAAVQKRKIWSPTARAMLAQLTTASRCS
ncbi:Guanine deaminase [Phytophthora megakarya]|uniref:Guanine deaminase n=1 Tax=Phytophthora megakarya TaxID=4795 RepID=A0A225VIW9_9STRA|nr:Guanine deaminase [Phytophthora megakarya]